MKAKIGIIVCGFIQDKQFVTNAYIQSIRYSGGIPLLLPLIRSDQMLKEYISLCDGFLFCGTGDITPLLFGQEPQNKNRKTNITLDLFQIRLMKQILKSRKPILSICRGMQVFNAACGGTIFQDISPQSENRLKIFVTPGSQLKKYIGSHLFVNSSHRQTIDLLGKELTACAISSDNTIEAIEMPSHPFAIGVQWHPENMYRSSPEMRELFGNFILKSTTAI